MTVREAEEDIIIEDRVVITKAEVEEAGMAVKGTTIEMSAKVRKRNGKMRLKLSDDPIFMTSYSE